MKIIRVCLLNIMKNSEKISKNCHNNINSYQKNTIIHCRLIGDL